MKKHVPDFKGHKAKKSSFTEGQKKGYL
eukprot:COSAG06_NODE_20529_length_792_cov_1.171717_2_plen_27_part_01